MKLKVIEIEATAEELRSSRNLADTINAVLNRMFDPMEQAGLDDQDDAEETG